MVRVSALLGMATSLCLVSGCSTGSGLLIADVYRTEGAYVVTMEGFGVTMRTVAEDAGLTLGYDRRSYVYPQRIDDPPEEGRHYFFVPLPKRAPVAVSTRAVGMDLRASSVEFGLTLGYRDTSLIALVPATESLYMRLRFLPDDVSATRLTYCPEEEPCWPIEIPDDVSASR